MTIEAFRGVDRDARVARPKVFLLATPDKRATPAVLSDLEKAIGVKLPKSYRDFLTEFGGGSYGLTTVFSADPQSEWYLPTRLDETKALLPPKFLPFSDDFAGGYYGLEIVDGQANEPVLYWNTDGGLGQTQFRNVLEYVARYAYQAA